MKVSTLLQLMANKNPNAQVKLKMVNGDLVLLQSKVSVFGQDYTDQDDPGGIVHVIVSEEEVHLLQD